MTELSKGYKKRLFIRISHEFIYRIYFFLLVLRKLFIKTHY